MTLATKLDWVAKRKMYQEYIDSEGVDWQDEVMQSLDLEYHNVNPSQSLFYVLEEAGQMERLIPHEEIARATCVSPSNTRAAARADHQQTHCVTFAGLCHRLGPGVPGEEPS